MSPQTLLRNYTPLLDDVLHCRLFRNVKVDLVLGQDFQDGPQFNPPLCQWDSVSAEKKDLMWKKLHVTALCKRMNTQERRLTRNLFAV